MKWIIALLVVLCGCASTNRLERTNIELRVEVIPDIYPQAYLSGRASHTSLK